MDDSTQESISNAIISRLEPEEAARLLPHLAQRELRLGEQLFGTGDPIEYVFFPEGSMGSYVGETYTGAAAEIGVIGREGVIGLDLFLGGKQINNTVIIQLPDGALQLPASVALDEFSRGGGFQRNILSFIRQFLNQVSQTAVCAALHLVDERLARWLLMCHDRARGDELQLTQEFLSVMVGVSRPSVSIAAHALQATEVIRYTRGKITVIDREGLEQFACECYQRQRDAESR